jgi:pSer/pThr/pTyr-binding forkhead associated (FHA) protein
VPPFVLMLLKIALLVLLYLFVWRAVRVVVVDLYGPREPRRTRTRPEPKPKVRPAKRGRGTPGKVVVITESGGKAGTHRLSGVLQIGRDPSCEIRLSDNYISQVHAKISNRNGSWFVEDMGSTNGTYLNQRKVTAPTEIGPGDRIRVGKTVLEVRK